MSEPHIHSPQYDVIIAHGPGCRDGATAAWCVWRTLSLTYRNTLAQEGGFYSDKDPQCGKSNERTTGSFEPYVHPNSPEGAMRLQARGFPVVFVFMQPGEQAPIKLVENKNVVILDLDMGDALVPLVRAAKRVLLSDHHDSTPLTIAKYSNILFEECRHKFATFVNTNKSESGATLAWELTHGTKNPPFIETVRIGDTWQWHEYPELKAREVLKSLHVYKVFRSFVDIENAFEYWDENFQSHAEEGMIITDYETALVKQMAKQCDIGYLQTNDGHVYTLAYTQANILHSEVGASMKWYAQKRFKVPIHFCATWKYVSHKGVVSVSLRDPGDNINLATIARSVKGTDGKGGGHASASGFVFYGLENFHNYISKTPPITTLNNSWTPITSLKEPYLP